MDFAKSIAAEQGLSETQYEADLKGLEKPTETDAVEETDEQPVKEAEAEETEEAEAEEAEAEETEAEETEEAEAEAEAEEAEVEEAAKAKPPKGYVPLQALREAREQIAALRESLRAIEAAKSETQTEPSSKVEDFVELTKEEEEALAADDTVSFVEYMNQKFTARFAQLTKAQEQQHEQAQINNAYSVIDSVAPGILEPESEVQQAFYDTAIANGFDESVFYLTNPATKVVLEDGSTRLLGADAAKVLGLVRNLQTQTSSPKKKAIVKRPKSTSLRKAPTKAPTKLTKNTMLSPAAFGALSPSDQEKFLRGEI